MEPILLIAATTNLADPLVPAWVTTALYLWLAIICGWTWWEERRAERQRRRGGSPFWMGLTVMFGLLGAAKPFNLQAMLTNTARGMSLEGDWYDSRRWIQFWFIVVVGATAALTAIALGWLARKRARKHLGALAATAILVGFLIVRATSFHYVDAVLYRTIGGVRINTMIETAILGMVAVALIRHAAEARRPH